MRMYKSRMFRYNLEKEINKWLTLIDTEESLPPGIKALHFGLFKNVDGYYSMYLIGSENFDKQSDDWACSEDFVPQSKYLHLKNKAISKLEWEKFLELVKDNLIKVLERKRSGNSIFDYIDNITVGFDDGDIHLINF